MQECGRIEGMYVARDTLSVRISLHDKYSVNRQGWHNWVFEQYAFAPGARVLEIGCGNGRVWQGREGLLPEGVQVLLTDFSPLMLDKARAALSGSSTFSYAQADIQALPYADGAFDAVIANHMLYHVPDLAKGLAEVARVLRPGGQFYASTFGQESYRELSQVYMAFPGGERFVRMESATFTLQNGEAVLRSYFADVKRREYIDALDVTSVDDMMDYIYSYNDVMDEERPALRALVASQFVDGVFHITKEQGIFVAKKA